MAEFRSCFLNIGPAFSNLFSILLMELSFISPLKGSVENRLLTSVFYDFGKSAFEQCPYARDLKNDETKSYLRSSLDNFLNWFPNLNWQDPDSPLYNYKVSVGVSNCSTYTPLGYIRRAVRNGFANAGLHTNKERGTSR